MTNQLTEPELEAPPPVDLGGTMRCRTGEHCLVRPIVPADARLLVEFHGRLSERTAYLRFFTFHPELTSGEVERFTHVDYTDRLALVVEHDKCLIGVGRYDHEPSTDSAEVAFVVADEWQHRGIGTQLLAELARHARRQRVHYLTAVTMGENRAMLGVFRHSGLLMTSSFDQGTVTVRMCVEPAIVDGARARRCATVAASRAVEPA